jgi:hypothetical protein
MLKFFTNSGIIIRGVVTMEIEKRKYNKIAIGVIVTHCIFLMAYFSLALHFRNHFYFGSTINLVDVSGKTVEEAEKQIANKFSSYSLKLQDSEGTEEIKASDIDLKYEPNGQVSQLKEEQNAFKWLLALINRDSSEMKEDVSYNHELLKSKVDKLDLFKRENITDSKDATFKYTGNGYEIVDEIYGNRVDKDVLYNKIVEAINNGEETLNIEKADCYIKPKYTAKSKEIIDTKNTLNKYIASTITYSIQNSEEVIDKSLINTWINVNENLEISFDEGKMRKDLDGIFYPYETVGKSREFKTSSGANISVGGGDYGWLLNTSAEIEDLIPKIKEGNPISKEPTYKQTAAASGSSDLGNTYVEISLSGQHMWFYKNGALIADGNVVTGNLSLDHGTPAGVYKLKYKQKDTSLVGQDYNAPVSFWMPFNGGIGIHDASWRNEFGGNIYKTNGSHGCINAPYALASAIYNNISAGVPVVLYY